LSTVLGPHDIGHRVVVRRVVGRRDGRPLMTDVLGILVALTESQLTVDTERHGRLAIDRVAVVAAKRVPPRRVAPKR
jgi:N-acetylglutamate synthase